MALETLSGLGRIGKFEILRSEDEPSEELLDRMKKYPVLIMDRANTICFKIQDGPIKDNGVNGCQVDTILQAGLMILEGLNKNFPCDFNIEAIAQLRCALDELNELEEIVPGEHSKAINHVKAALHQMDLRTQERESRGVEGQNKA